ncbi:MAG: LamG domain-containing protein [Victivallaceae bacterium]|nr:LamG domain-containing protein [Victivallaceae bacterium]
MKFIRCFIAVLFLSAMSSVADAEQIKAFWPLNEGSGNIVHSKPTDYKGLFEGKGDAVPKWQGAELNFFGNKGYGAVKIPGGGKILSGPVFGVGFEVKPATDKFAGHFICCKHSSTKDGGFYVHYWNAAKKLSFGFADGRKRHVFSATLKKRLKVGVWSTFKAEYNGERFTMTVNGKVVLEKKIPGLIMGTDKTPLYIGNYVRPLKSMFTGSIRNVKLWLPEAARNVKGFVSATQGTPKLDGKLDDAVWEKSKFMGGFVINCDKTRLAKNQTSFALAADKKNLYVAIISNIDPNKPLKSGKNERDAKSFWQDDTVELFLSPWGTDHCIQLAVNPGGSRQDLLLQYQMTRQQQNFNPKWQVATTVGKKQWIAEIAIPYDQIMVPPQGSNGWKFNVCRTDQSQPILTRYSSWGQIPAGAKYKGFADAKLFSSLAGVPAPSYSKKQQKKVISAIRRWGVDKLTATSPFSMIAAAPTMFVPNNMTVPNSILTSSNGKVIMREKNNVRFRFDLPAGVELLTAGTKKGHTYGYYKIIKQQQSVMRNGKKYSRYELAPLYVHWACSTIHLYLKSSLPNASERTMYFSSKWQGGSQPWQPIKLKIMKFPEPGMPRGILASYTWLPMPVADSWPDCIATLAKLGFNTFPFQRFSPKFSTEEIKNMAAEARRYNMKIIAVISPFYGIKMKVAGNSTGANGKPLLGIKDACPAYRGKIYQDNLKRITAFTKLLKPDYVQFDIEKYTLGAHNGETGNCYRCLAVIKASGKQPAEVMTDLGVQIALDLRKSVAAGVTQNPIPDCGIYHTKPGGFVYEGVFNLDKLKKADAMQLAHPVYYNTRPIDAGRTTRKYRKLFKNNKVYPWVTNGYNSSAPPELNYDMTLNVYGSGAGGMYWYGIERIEGADFYYYAKAMEAVNPVSAMLAKSTPFKLDFSASAGVSVSGLRSGNNAVLLVACGKKQTPGGQVTVTLPAKLAGTIWSLPARQAVAKIHSGKATFIFTPAVKGTRAALYYIGTTPPGK